MRCGPRGRGWGRRGVCTPSCGARGDTRRPRGADGRRKEQEDGAVCGAGAGEEEMVSSPRPSHGGRGPHAR
eukprot:scaffold3786_cov336-Prasinococcus_capsulatus_cf.AAC.1